MKISQGEEIGREKRSETTSRLIFSTSAAMLFEPGKLENIFQRSETWER
jgi:hypothetical protein